jgi:hypothetical protein
MLAALLLGVSWARAPPTTVLARRTPTRATSPALSTPDASDSYQPLDAAYERKTRQETFQKLAASGALPPLPDGRTLSIALGSLADCDTGGRVWSSASVLCKWLREQIAEVRGRELLELGCGSVTARYEPATNPQGTCQHFLGLERAMGIERILHPTRTWQPAPWGCTRQRLVHAE